MRLLDRRTVTAATAAVSLLVAGAPLAQAAPSPAGDALLDRPLRGEAAVAALGARLPEVAAENRLAAKELVALLREDRTLWLDRAGRLHVKDDVTTSGATPGTAVAAPYPNTQTFSLHSKPGAARTIYLDFDGHVVKGTAWNSQYGVDSAQPAFDLDGNPSEWSQTEHDTIQDVYQRVSEDFAPFDVDVTTQDPGEAALVRSSSSDTTYGARALITPSAEATSKICGGGCGGAAYTGVFNRSSSGSYQPAWVFPHFLDNNAKNIAEAASHEVGHNLGLLHDGTAGNPYYAGHSNWAPIMGVGYDEPLVQWSRGQYPGANNTQDDLAVMQAYGLPVAADDHGSTPGTARALGTASSAAGVIERPADLDFFSIERTCSGSTQVTVTPAPDSPNLDTKLTLLAASGSVLAADDPGSGQTSADLASGLSSSVTADLSAGRSYVTVDGVGARDLSTGYSDYGSLGRYTVSISPCPAGVASAPLDVTVTAASASSATVSWAPPASDGGSPITGYRVAHDGGSAGGTAWSTTASATSRSQTLTQLAAGATYTVTVEAMNAAGTGAAASAAVTLPSGDATLQEPGTTLQENSPGVSLNGWSVSADPAASGGSYRSSGRVGDVATFKFSGTAVTWLTRKGPSQGIATVSIDGVSKGTVDLYAGSPTTFAQSFTGLTSTAHTLKITVTGKNAASQGQDVVVDAFRVGTATTEDTAPKIVFARWTGVSSTSASGGAYRWATTSTSTASLTFSGTSIRWVTATGPAYGRARVTIDGADKGVVDLYSATATWKVEKAFTGLSTGNHTIAVQVLGTKDASSTGTRVVLDGFVVGGPVSL